MGALQSVYSFAWAQWQMPMWNHWGPGMMGWGIGGGGWLGGVFMLVWWMVVIAAVVAFIRWVFAAKKPAAACAPPVESPLDVARKRYARGEIDQEQFRIMKRELEG
ncbi:MAG: SHOCT domain-containing protein [Desulfobacterales bacterium]